MPFAKEERLLAGILHKYVCYDGFVFSTDLDPFWTGSASGIESQITNQSLHSQPHAMAKIDVHHHVYPPVFTKGTSTPSNSSQVVLEHQINALTLPSPRERRWRSIRLVHSAMDS